jgi:hypothetical protein
MGRRISTMDPTIQWAGGQMPWILLLNGHADWRSGSYYTMGQRIGTMDPTTQGQADRCRGSYYPMGGPMRMTRDTVQVDV